MAGEFRGDLARMLRSVGPSPLARLSFYLLNSEMHCVACYRLGQFADRLRAQRTVLALPVMVAYHVWDRWCTHIHHCAISRRAQIGEGLLLMHRTGVIIGPVIAGRAFTVYQNVTIGLRVAHNDQGLPRLGDGVWIGPGAILSGAITVGDHATISAGTVLSRDVPAGCLVAGNPGRVIARDYDNSDIVNTVLPDA